MYSETAAFQLMAVTRSSYIINDFTAIMGKGMKFNNCVEVQVN